MEGSRYSADPVLWLWKALQGAAGPGFRLVPVLLRRETGPDAEIRGGHRNDQPASDCIYGIAIRPLERRTVGLLGNGLESGRSYRRGMACRAFGSGSNP